MLFRKNKNKLPEELEKHIETHVDKDAVWIQRMVSHNVRMPMSVIRGYGDLLRQGLLKGEEEQEAIKSICDNIMYLDQILNVIFEYDKTEDINFSKVNISELIKRVTGYVKDIAAKSNINIRLILEKEALYINADIVPMMRAFYQLFENAFKYLTAGCTISISAYEADDKVLIVYKDDGMGISQEETEKVINEGYRGHNSKGKSGSGFGLYDLDKVIKQYNGLLEIKSNLNEGFSVFMVFPRMDNNE